MQQKYKYRGIGNVILNILEDNEWHTTDQLVEECKEYGIDLEEAREPVYNAVFRLKNKGVIESSGAGRFRKKFVDSENVDEESIECDTKEIDFASALEVVEQEVENCKEINWKRCSDEELRKAREILQQLIRLSDEIQEMVAE